MTSTPGGPLTLFYLIFANVLETAVTKVYAEILEYVNVDPPLTGATLAQSTYLFFYHGFLY